MNDENTIMLMIYPNHTREILKNIAKESATKSLEMVGYQASFDVEYVVDDTTGNEYIKLTLTDID